VDDVLDPLGSRHAVGFVRRMLEVGTGADRQLKVYEESGGDLVKVTEYIESSFLI
jgi:carboxylate-amine ligase